MARLSARTIIHATPERVWEVLSDFGGIAASTPHLRSSTLTSEEPVGVGASRHCALAWPGVSTDETVTRWVEGQGYSVTIRMNGMPMRNARADFDTGLEEGHTVLTGIMSYDLPFGVVGRVLDKLVARRMSAVWAGTLAGFKARAESGAEIGADTPLGISAVEVG